MSIHENLSKRLHSFPTTYSMQILVGKRGMCEDIFAETYVKLQPDNVNVIYIN